jgi:hypothetical protein
MPLTSDLLKQVHAVAARKPWDKADTQAARGEVRERFAGVSNCEFCFDGFSKEAVEFIARG